MRAIPTINQLYTQISNDFKNKYNISIALKLVLNAASLVIAAQLWLLYKYLSDVQDNVFPDTAQSESQGGTLERIGRIHLGRNPFNATTGVFKLSVTGVAGSILRASLTFKSNDDALNAGQLYILDGEYILTGTDDVIEVRSMGGGTDYNLNVGDRLTITEPVIGVNQTVTVDSVTTQPTDAESLEDYRQKILDKIQLEAQGGAKTDYRLWASDTAGVRKVYPYVRESNAGIVDIYVEATIADSTDIINGYGLPSNALLAEVEEVVEFDPDETKPVNERGRRPTQAIPIALPIVRIPVDITITGLNQNTTDIQNAIKTALSDYLYDVRPYIAGADLARNKNNVLYSARVQSVVADAIGNTNFFVSFNMEVNGASVPTYDFDLGNIPYLRNVTFS